MITYFQPVHLDNQILASIDKVVICYKISNNKLREELMTLLQKLPFYEYVEIQHWQSFKPFSFHDNFSIQFPDSTSFWLGIGLNQLGKTDYSHIQLEFNPNKVAHHGVFCDLHTWLTTNSERINRSIKRYDLAFDIPVERKYVIMLPDRRTYSCIQSNGALTEYLGAKSSTVGRVKLYDKSAESQLNSPLTRLELTLSPQMEYDELHIPDVYVVTDYQLRLDGIKLTDTDLFILNAILQHCGQITSLGRGEKAKIKAIIDSYLQKVILPLQNFRQIQSQLRNYVESNQ